MKKSGVVISCVALFGALSVGTCFAFSIDTGPIHIGPQHYDVGPTGHQVHIKVPSANIPSANITVGSSDISNLSNPKTSNSAQNELMSMAKKHPNYNLIMDGAGSSAKDQRAASNEIAEITRNNQPTVVTLKNVAPSDAAPLLDQNKAASSVHVYYPQPRVELDNSMSRMLSKER